MHTFFDPWANIVGPNGKFLIGRLTFLEPDTSGNLKAIYSVDGLPLSNPIYTDLYGKTSSQVMLQDSDYKVRFEAYIGQGNMVNDQSAQNWLLYKTAYIKNGIVSTDNTIEIKSVTSIDALKDLENMNDGDIIEVIGYYTAGDSGESRFYKWNATGTAIEDGGSVIKSDHTTVGYWSLIVPGTYIDVRWFGDLPDASAKNASTTTSNLSQRVKAANFANAVNKDLYFPKGFYYFSGANTVSVNKNILLDSFVRFCVKEGTTGTSVQAKEVIGSSAFLFIPEYNSSSIGQYALIADWIDTAWLYTDKTTDNNARFGYIINSVLRSDLTFTGKTVIVNTTFDHVATFDNCSIDSNKKISKAVFRNMDIDTRWLIDNWETNGQITIESSCTVSLSNCRNANEYILVKNMIGDYNYGDLQEQTVNATIKGDSVLENFNGNLTVDSSGTVEIHNASVTIAGLTNANSLNCVDTWLTLPSSITLNHLFLRRGSISGTNVTVQVNSNSVLERVDLNVNLYSVGTDLTINDSNIRGVVEGSNIELVSNQIYAQVGQSDVAGVVTVKCISNTFNDGARHYVHANTANSVVNGIWANNCQTYDTSHWIRLDRTNLKDDDAEHKYAYMNNSDLYLDKYSGRNHPMRFKLYRGHWVDATGKGCYETYDTPFLFLNDWTHEIYAVARTNYWKMFSVGRTNFQRSATVRSKIQWLGYAEGADNNGAQIPVLWQWGLNYDVVDGQPVTSLEAVSRDGTGEADFNVSFDAADQVYNIYQYGVKLGYPTNESWANFPHPFQLYPSSESHYWYLYVFPEKDFASY